MEKTGGVVHGVAKCTDCDWQSASYKNILAISANHAKHYKHRVHVEVGSCFTYDGKEKV